MDKVKEAFELIIKAKEIYKTMTPKERQQFESTLDELEIKEE